MRDKMEKASEAVSAFFKTANAEELIEDEPHAFRIEHRLLGLYADARPREQKVDTPAVFGIA